MNLAGLFVAVFMGAQMLAREIERRTLDVVLSKPVRRREFMIGQFIGLLATLALSLTAMAVAMYVVLVAMALVGNRHGARGGPTGCCRRSVPVAGGAAHLRAAFGGRGRGSLFIDVLESGAGRGCRRAGSS